MTPAQRDEAVHQLCARAGLPLSGWRERSGVLELVPQSLDELPDAAALAALGLELKAVVGARWVTLRIEES